MHRHCSRARGWKIAELRVRVEEERNKEGEREREQDDSPFCMQSMQHFVSCNWSFRAGVEVKDKLIYFEAAAHRTERSIYVLANAPILYCPLAFKQNKAGTGGAQTDDDESEWKQNKNHTKVKATLWNPFIVHCQHALIKNASTFADSSVNCMQLLSLPLFTTLSVPSPLRTTTVPRRGGGTSANCNLQCADEARRARIRGTLLEKYRKLVCLIEQCLSELNTTTGGPTHMYTHSFVAHVCEWVCKNAVALW